jgi:hypothetical protein
MTLPLMPMYNGSLPSNSTQHPEKSSCRVIWLSTLNFAASFTREEVECFRAGDPELVACLTKMGP